MRALSTILLCSAWVSAIGHNLLVKNAHLGTHGHEADEAMQLVNASYQPSGAQSYGDLSCMRNTGGMCNVFSCRSERGPTVCENGRCMCQPGTCANAEGVCERTYGKWLGEYSIRFTKPYDPAKPFIGVGSWGLGSRLSIGTSGVFSSRDTLAASSNSQPEWKIALTAHGHVRFESLSKPGKAMHIYANRRRRSSDSRRRSFFLQLEEETVQGNSMSMEQNRTVKAHSEETINLGSTDNKVLIPDDDDHWPILVNIPEAQPNDVTFRVRPTQKNGGGLEIWDPQTGYALASANPDWTFRDNVAGQGIAECSGSWFAGDCKGRQLVEFNPELPVEATPYVARDYITAYGAMAWWQVLLVFFLIVGLVVGCLWVRD